MNPEPADLPQMLEESIDSGDWESVRELAERVLTSDPEHVRARVFLSLAKRKIHSTDECGPKTALGLGGVDSEVFIGREREASRLKVAFEEAFAGRGRLVAIAGEPGIGKTRMAEQLAAYAASRNALVFWGRVHEEAGSPPNWPWVQVIRSYIDTQESDVLRQSLGKTAGVIAGMVPELEERLGEILPPQTLGDPESERFLLID